MVKANDLSPCWKHSAQEFPSLNYMSASIEQQKNETLPTYANNGTYMFSENMVFPRFSVSGRPGFETGRTNEAHKPSQCQLPNVQSWLHAANPCPKGKYDPSSSGISEKAVPNALSGPAPKKFLFFDRTGNQTRLILNPSSYHTQKPSTALPNPDHAHELHAPAANTREMYLMNNGENFDENHIISEESEMHEDTEEINALLYSDDDYDCNDDDDDDDDEISTGHSPIGTEDSHEKQEQVGVMTEEVATSDVPAKRLKLLNGGYGKSLVLNHANSVKPGESYDYDDDAESSYTKGRTQGVEIASILGRKRPRDDKIHNTLEILENLIPGGKGKDPLVILDEAIKYLISLKLKAKSQGAFPL